MLALIGKVDHFCESFTFSAVYKKLFNALNTNKQIFLWCVTLQPLSVFTSSLAVAENMADLIDGYFRLESTSETSLIVRPNKGTLSHKILKFVNW